MARAALYLIALLSGGGNSFVTKLTLRRSWVERRAELDAATDDGLPSRLGALADALRSDDQGHVLSPRQELCAVPRRQNGRADD